MLPFVFVDESKLGPFHAFGVCIALGFFAWDWAVMRQAARRGLDRKDFRACTIWIVTVGIFVAWVSDAVFYHPADRSVGSTLFSLQGFSSMGGICGAVLGALVWRWVWIGREGGALRVRRRERPAPLLSASDVIVSTWPIGFGLGRLGCALIHDHVGVGVAPGTLGSLFAVGFPRAPSDGLDHAFGPLHVVTGGSDVRFDLGLLESAVLLAIALVFASTWRRRLRPGTYSVAGALLYGPVRFLLDFLRPEEGPTGDLRHGGLTFAQYFSLVVIVLALAFLAKRRRSLRAALPATAAAFLACSWPSAAHAAPPWVERPQTLPRLVFAGNVGLGLGHVRVPAPNRDLFGPGLNLEAALGVTDKLELGLRTGVRFGDDGRLAGADAYGRTLWTETYGTGVDVVANPELRIRWTAYRGDVVEVGLDGRAYMPVEDRARFGMMFGVPLTFHAGHVLRIDTGVYVPVVFYDPAFNAIAVPAYFWFQVTDRLWLGPMFSLRSIDPGRVPSRDRRFDLLLGFGLGYQVASMVDLKTMFFFPRINDDDGLRYFGAGFGVEFRINE